METRGYRVEVKGYPPLLFYGKSRSAARMSCASSIVEAWDCQMVDALISIKRVVLATAYEIENVENDTEIKLTDRKLNVRPESEAENGSKYEYCNHHHELTSDHELVNIGGNEFVANKKAIPLLKALNNVGLKARSHHIGDPSENAFVCLIIDNLREVEINDVADGRKQLVIQWDQLHVREATDEK